MCVCVCAFCSILMCMMKEKKIKKRRKPVEDLRVRNPEQKY